MEQEAYRKSAYDMIRLVRCALRGETPDKDWVRSLDLPALFEVCQKHILTACTAYALESAGIEDHEFTQAKMKAIRKNILMDAERKQILARLEKEQIWYMPLKGAILKDWYPKLGMRQMSDNDILCDDAYRKQIKTIMEDMGFSCDHWGKGNDDAYFKPPVCNFEMHNELFTSAHIGNLHSYYANVKERLLKDENNSYGYHFRTEDFYIYLTAHEYKHFAGGGTGVRSLVDTYVFMQKFGDVLDWDYLNAELKKLDIVDYERQNRELAEKLFSGEELSEQEKSLLDYYIFSGTYGVQHNKVENSIQRMGGDKSKYVFSRIFPPMKQVKSQWPFFYRHKWLLPVLWIYRPIHGLAVNREKIKSELQYLKKDKPTDD